MEINAFDFDGVVSLGINPAKNDVIITGRTFDEAEFVNSVLLSRGIKNAVYFNPIWNYARGTFTHESRKCSGKHKATILSLLKKNGVKVSKFFEDDEIQIKEIKKAHPNLNVIHVVQKLSRK